MFLRVQTKKRTSDTYDYPELHFGSTPDPSGGKGENKVELIEDKPKTIAKEAQRNTKEPSKHVVNTKKKVSVL
jgi:hypothetical protein